MGKDFLASNDLYTLPKFKQVSNNPGGMPPAISANQFFALLPDHTLIEFHHLDQSAGSWLFTIKCDEFCVCDQILQELRRSPHTPAR